MNVVYARPGDVGEWVGAVTEAQKSSEVQQIVTNAERALAAYRARVWRLVSEGLMTEAEGEHLCSERYKAVWLRQYLARLSRLKMPATQQRRSTSARRAAFETTSI